MAKLRIRGDTSGYVDIAAPAVAGTTTVNLDKIPQTDQNTTISKDTPEFTLQSTNTQAHFRLESTLNNSVWMISNESNADRMRIMHTNTSNSTSTFPMYLYEAGYVTMPSQPAFCAARTTAYQTTGNGTQNLIWDDVKVNVGGGYNSSTGRFTAPVTGNYVINAYQLTANDSSSGDMRFAINGTIVTNLFGYGSNTTNHKQGYISGMFNLSTNDYIEVRGWTTQNWNELHGSIWGFLVG